MTYSLTEARTWTFEQCAEHVAEQAIILARGPVGDHNNALVYALNDFKLENGSDGAPARFVAAVEQADLRARAILRTAFNAALEAA